MGKERNMQLRDFVLHQVVQLRELFQRLIRCLHHSYQQDEKLKLTEERLEEAKKKYELLTENLDHIRATCPHEYQCPVRKLKLK